MVDLLTDLDATVGTAESLTGGRLAAALTQAPGSSAVFAGGVVSYHTRVKVEVLGVAEETTETDGVVSESCARQMADGVRRVLGTTYGISTTGVAGPDTQEGKAVGTVFVGAAGPEGTKVEELALDGDRDEIQRASVEAALSALQEMISSAGRSPEDSTLR
ncbi:CinA family protein [Nocardioides sp. zg-536]|uniref:CinA family protein n=1 Tax=Nocardioides faecalis TaxID=2803858 RepID=A0A938Y6F3_9ACTN|nr:CinA family protein [Nocardioides faecalis]MBS4754178.1 CinA family protein [Nocardioides faecalis]QVI60531.1 CinA family protein [Nocardioides faecalis]